MHAQCKWIAYGLPFQDKLIYFRIKELKDVLNKLGLAKQGKKQVACFEINLGSWKGCCVMMGTSPCGFLN